MITIEIDKLINEEYKKIEKAESNYQKLNFINNVIIYRTEFGPSTIPELYADVRKYIEYYFDSIYELKGDYYEFQEDKFNSIINLLPLQERLRLFEYANRLTKKGAFDNYNDWINEELNKVKLKNYLENFEFKNIISIVGCLSSYNLLSISLTFVLLFIIVFTIFLPAYSSNFIIFETKHFNYNKDFYLNHFINLATYIFQTDDEFKVIPINFSGIIILVFIKVISIGLLSNYLLKEFSRRI